MIDEREQLERAKTLIEQKDYQAARDILQAMPEHPIAQQWLAKIDAVLARQTPPPDDTVQRVMKEARVLIEAKDYQAARAALRPIEHLNPTAREWAARLDRRLANPARPISGPITRPISKPVERPPILPKPISRPHERSAAAAREALITGDEAKEWDKLEMHPALRQTEVALKGMGINPRLAGVAVGVGITTGILVALLDAILGIPGPFLTIGLGWIVAALNGPTYAILRKKIDFGAWAMSIIVGFLTMLVWYILTVLIGGDPNRMDGDLTARDTYAYWFDENLNIIQAVWSGMILGALSLGWYALIPRLPAWADRVVALAQGMQGRLGDTRDES